MDEEEYRGQQEAEDADGEVGNPEEVVLPAEPAGRGEHQLLLAAESVGVVLVQNGHADTLVLHQIRLNLPPQFPERRQRCRAHPHDQILVFIQLLQQKRA